MRLGTTQMVGPFSAQRQVEKNKKQQNRFVASLREATDTPGSGRFETGPFVLVCYGTIHVPLCAKLVVVPPASVALI